MSHPEKWQGILNEVREWQRPLKERGYSIWFRGQRCSRWGAYSSLHRYINACFNLLDANRDQREKAQLLRSVYKSSYRKFKARAWRFIDQSERSQWGIVFAMQHYGLPTPLLDWTESFACALYFAQQERSPECDAAIYLLNPEGLNLETSETLRKAYKQRGEDCEMGLGEGLIPLEETFNEGNYSSHFHPQHLQFDLIAPEWCRTIAVAPFLSNPRMLAQRAAFTLCGWSFQPLEEQFGNNIIKKVLLPADTYEDTQEFLSLVGIGHFGYFPDLINLVRDLKDEMNREFDDVASFVKRSPPASP